jgi:hypothetical protein
VKFQVIFTVDVDLIAFRFSSLKPMVGLAELSGILYGEGKRGSL